jgi:ABC-type branched-subunit amino acid transport system substrate-binding protein
MQLINDPQSPYTKYVQCSGSSTNTLINDPLIKDSEQEIGSDKNDSLYRCVANDKQQAALGWNLVKNKSTFGIFYINDSYGQSFFGEISKKAKDSGHSLVFAESFPEKDFSIKIIESKLEQLLTLNKQGKLQTLLLIGLPSHGGEIVKFLVEAPSPYRGTLLLTDGMVEATFFTSLTTDFTRWIKLEGNRLFATAPETYAGELTAPWIERITKKHPAIDLSNAFLPSESDCLYAMALALMQEERSEQHRPEALKRAMRRLKASNYSGVHPTDIVDISPDAAGLKRAQQALAAQKRVRLNGASGTIVFDQDGDRLDQLYKTMEPRLVNGLWQWATVSIFEGTTGSCKKNCP